ncbi:uncharacterized protein TNCV_2530601 [Trichonephila clavipes]|nr:uncharacterized protein TNCV_2530601 [Trichonephila clavipes]
MDPMQLCPGKCLVLPNLNVGSIALHPRFLILTIPSNEKSRKSLFAIQKTLNRIGGDPKSVKNLRSDYLLFETTSSLQTKSFLLTKTFLESPLTVRLHKTLNSCQGVISEADLMTTLEAEILDRFSDQGVIQARKITIKKKESEVIPTKHLILTFNSPNLPTTIKAAYLNCEIRPCVPNSIRCFKCQRFGH